MNSIGLLISLTLFLIALPYVYASDDFSDFPTPEECRWEGLNNAVTIDETKAFIEKQGVKYDAQTIYGSLMMSSSERDYSCVKTFGHIGFCQCIGSELPAYLSFEGYVAIVTGQDTTSIFQGMQPADAHAYYKRIIDVRDSCVAKLRNNELHGTMPSSGRGR